MLVNATWKGSPSLFAEVFQTEPGNYDAIWEAVGKTPWGRELPGYLDAAGRDHRIAYRIHGDGFRVYRNQKMMALGMKATSAMGDPWKTRLLFTLIPLDIMITAQTGPKAKSHTLYHALKVYGQMLNILHEGRVPRELPPGVYPRGLHEELVGEAICGPYTFGYLGLSGDLEFKRDANFFIPTKQYWACQKRCCSKCDGSRVEPAMAFDDLSRHAPWRNSLVSTAKYLERTLPHHRTPLTCITGWAHELDMEDLLHVEYQGTGQDFAGSVVISLCNWGFYGPGPLKDQMVRCTKAAREYQKREWGVHETVAKFTPDSFIKNDGAEMPGKAAFIKRMIGFVAQEARLFDLHEDPERSRQLASTCSALSTFGRILDQCGEIMAPDCVAACVTGFDNFQKGYLLFSQAANDEGELTMWRIRPKFHMFAHICDFMAKTSLNPRFWAMWMDEDFMGKLRDMRPPEFQIRGFVCSCVRRAFVLLGKQSSYGVSTLTHR